MPNPRLENEAERVFGIVKISEEPPPYSSPGHQRYESFENPLTGSWSGSVSFSEGRPSSGNPQFVTALYDFTAGGDDEHSITASEELEIEDEVDGWYYAEAEAEEDEISDVESEEESDDEPKRTKGTQGVIQIENPNLAKPKNLKARDVDTTELSRRERGQAEREFKVEVEAIGKVKHKNLVSLLGYCAEGSQRLLVYEYIDNGNLEQWLHGDVGLVSPLTWEIRMKIATGTARGLAYLHEGLEPKVVHQDVKSSNMFEIRSVLQSIQ